MPSDSSLKNNRSAVLSGGVRSAVEPSQDALSEKLQELNDTRRAIVNVLEDLTAAKNEIEAAKAYDEALLSSMGDGVMAVDTNGFFVAGNWALEQLFGWKLDELRGRNVFESTKVYNKDGEPIRSEQRTLYRALHAPSYSVFRDHDHYYKRKTGELIPVAVDTSPIILNGRTVGAIGVYRDITREKQIEEAKNEFVSLASHQLRTPLTSIGWYAELLLGDGAGPLNERQQEYAREIYGANKRMIQLVDALLNVSRIELGTFGIEPVRTDMVTVCRETISDVAAIVARKHLTINEMYEPAEVVITADPNLLRIIFQNLLSNAIKYTPDSGTISVRVENAGERVLISVTDSGIGIPKEVQSKIFDKMYRADNARIADPDGNGLGLYLVKSIVDRSGGTISFASEEGKGTTFKVSYPASGMVPRSGPRRLQPSTPVKSLEELA